MDRQALRLACEAATAQIYWLEGRQRHLSQERSRLQFESFWLSLSAIRYTSADQTRDLFKRLNVWVGGVVALGPLVVGVAAFAAAHLSNDNLSASIVVGLLTTVAAIVFVIGLLLYPSHKQVHSQSLAANFRLDRAKASLERCNSELTDVDRQLESENRRFAAARRALSQADELEALRAGAWQAMDGVAFEQYLARVFRALGYSVQTTPASGDHGVDLVVQKGAVRIAVQAKCYQGNVDNSAVQQAVAGMKMYGCNACSAITNSRFTGGAVTLAQANNCILVDANNFDRFVTGEFDLALTVAATTAALR